MSSSLSGKSRASQPLFLLPLFGLLLVAAILLAPGSRATRQSPVSSTTSASSRDGAGKRTRPQFVPGEALVRFKKGKAIEGATYVAVPRTSVVGEAAAAPQDREQILMQVERFEGSDLVDGLRLARVQPQDTLKAVASLKARPDVLYAEPNYILQADATTPNDTSFGQLYGLTKIGAPQAWDTIRGSSDTAQAFFGTPRVVVGVVDEGIDISHTDLITNIWNNPTLGGGDIAGISGDIHGYDFRDNTGSVFSGDPLEDHATHVAGTIGAVGNNAQGVVGVNWKVGLISLKFLGPGGGSDADAIRAFSYAKQMRDLWYSSGGTKGANIRVLNNSYGGSGYSQITADAINALAQPGPGGAPGILFVAAAGNDGTNNDAFPHYPSGYSLTNVIPVAATNSSDQLASFSNFGARSVLIGAPGVNILSTTPGNTYQSFSGTSMAAPHVVGAAALICAAYPNITLNQLRGALSFNGDVLAALQGKTLTGRRLNVKKSLDAIAENDTTPPGTPTGFQITSQSGRTVNLSWTASGDDDAAGQASLYDLSFTDQASGAVVPLTTLAPPVAGTAQSQSVKIPYRHTSGTIKLREFDNVGNEGTPGTISVSVDPNIADPYTTSLNSPAALSTGGTALGLTFDDRYRENYALPFSFPFFGQLYNTVTISTNGNLYFSAPPKRGNGDADDVPSSIADLSRFKMIAGMWDDIDLRTSRRADADIYVLKPDPTRIIFRWQGVQYGDGVNGDPINFEIELRADGSVKTRYGNGNTNLNPVVGVSAGEPDAYVIDSLTSETNFKTLTNAQGAVFMPRVLRNPIDDARVFVAEHYLDFLNRLGDPGGLDYWTNEITKCGSDEACINDRRIGVSGSFFVEQEFQETGFVVYRCYRAAYGVLAAAPNRANLSYAQFTPDRAMLIGGAGLAQSTTAFVNNFVQRPEFLAAYPNTMTNTEFVNKLFDTASLTGANYAALRQSEIDVMTNSGRTRAQVLLDVIDVPDFKAREYNPAWVLMEYFGYLRRDAEQGGYDFWLDVLNGRELNNYRGMVCSFITSQEYQQRFSPVFSRTNQLCAGVH